MTGSHPCGILIFFSALRVDPKSVAGNTSVMGVYLAIQDRITESVAHWLDYRLFDNSVRSWIVAGAVAAAILIGFPILRKVVQGRLLRLAKRTSSQLDDLVVGILTDLRWWLVLVTALYLSGRVLTLPSGVDRSLWGVFVIAVVVQLLITSRLVVDFAIGAVVARHKADGGEPDPSIVSASGIIRSVVMLTAGSLLLLLALANLGVEVTPLITGLGIGGIAVALAAQSILGDLFGSLTILFDKPFLVGDFIIVGDQMGTIERIGIKTTRVRALSGEQLVFSNTDLLSSRIRNFKRMYERRVVFSVGVVYETPVEKLQRIPQIVRESILAQPQTRFDRAHFNTFGAYSLNFEAVYFVTTPDYNRYMDIQQAINLELVRRFGEEHIEFAYPTQVEIYRPAEERLPKLT